jgi:hypothetical protein
LGRGWQEGFLDACSACVAAGDGTLDCMAGCHASHQQTAFAEKKQHDAVFFVNTAPRASADPRLAYSRKDG